MKDRISQCDVYLKRIYTDINKYTIGQIWIDGKFVCDTLEDPVRQLPEVCPYTPKYQNCKCKEKIYGDTAIPAKTYWCRVSYSPRFKGYYIEIMDVMHFLGIRIHSGVHKDHTEGCVLVGEYNAGYNGNLQKSFEAMNRLKGIIQTKLIDNQWNEKGGFFKIIIQ